LRGAVRISFRDTGPGIPEEERRKVFTPFWTTKRDGNGLGLALAHKTITDHGGRITLHSRIGVGTEFVLMLPTEEAAT
jgi:signal transduction histidine kinase